MCDWESKAIRSLSAEFYLYVQLLRSLEFQRFNSAINVPLFLYLDLDEINGGVM